MESLDPRMPSPLLEAAEQFCTFELLPAMIPAPVDPVPVTVVLELSSAVHAVIVHARPVIIPADVLPGAVLPVAVQ